MKIDFNRTFMDLTEAEVREAITAILNTKRITCFRKMKDCFRMKIYTDWVTKDDNGKEIVDTICDTIEVRDPWENGMSAIEWDCADGRDIRELRKFCFAKGICEYAKNNPFLAEDP